MSENPPVDEDYSDEKLFLSLQRDQPDELLKDMDHSIEELKAWREKRAQELEKLNKEFADSPDSNIKKSPDNSDEKLQNMRKELEKYKKERENKEKQIKKHIQNKPTPKLADITTNAPKGMPSLQQLQSDLDNLEINEIEKNIKREAEINALGSKDDGSNDMMNKLNDMSANLQSYEEDLDNLLNQM